ncbi:MAG: hypothetical protein PUB18_02550, partial [bacterium]|nr:hypothetical protein [bacterium]
FDQSDPSSKNFYESNHMVIHYPTVNQKEVFMPELNFADYYQVEVNDDRFSLPDVEMKDQNSNSLAMVVEYYFKGMYQLQYTRVSDFRLDQVGSYRIRYIVTNLMGKTMMKEIVVDIIDQTKPVIEGYIEEYNSITNVTNYQPVASHSTINQAIKIVLNDNDGIMYAEYYKALYEVVDGNTTLEKESMMNVIDINLEKDFYLYEDGEYHIRAYDNSGNYQEYTIIIDRTSPIVSVTYEQVNLNQVLVTIITDEEVVPIQDFIANSENQMFTKLYDYNVMETVVINDLAGNQVEISISVDTVAEVLVDQNGNLLDPTNYLQLHLHDGPIFFRVNNSYLYEVFYQIDGGGYSLYTPGYNLDRDGFYEFQVRKDGFTNAYSFYISNQAVED